MFVTIMYKTKEGSKLSVGKILEGVVVAETLGDTLVEFHLLCFS